MAQHPAVIAFVSVKHSSVCSPGYYFLQGLQMRLILNREIWEYFVYFSNYHVFSDGAEEIIEISYSEPVYFS
jgi:hypothetical protein